MKKVLLFLMKICVSGVLAYLIVLKIEWSQLQVSLLQGNYWYIVLAALIGTLFNFVKFFKWHFLIDLESGKYSYADASKSYMIGNALGLITPMRAGDLGRVLYFPPGEKSKILGLTIADRVIDLSAVFVLAISGSFILINKTLGTLMLLLTLVSILVLIGPAVSKTILEKRLVGIASFRDKIEKLSNVLDTLSIRMVSFCFLLSLVAFVLVILEFYFLVSAFEDISLWAVFLVAPLITLSSIIPVSIMGLGVREGLSVLLLSEYGVSAATGMTAAFLLFILNNVSISLIGILFFSRLSLLDRKLNGSRNR